MSFLKQNVINCIGSVSLDNILLWHTWHWRPLLGLLSYCHILKSSQSNPTEDRATVDLIYGGLFFKLHYNEVIMGAMASQMTSLTIVYSTFYSEADRRKHQSSASLAFVRGIHRGPVNSPHKGPVTRKMFPFDDVSMGCRDLPTWSGTDILASTVAVY